MKRAYAIALNILLPVVTWFAVFEGNSYAMNLVYGWSVLAALLTPLLLVSSKTFEFLIPKPPYLSAEWESNLSDFLVFMMLAANGWWWCAAAQLGQWLVCIRLFAARKVRDSKIPVPEL